MDVIIVVAVISYYLKRSKTKVFLKCQYSKKNTKKITTLCLLSIQGAFQNKTTVLLVRVTEGQLMLLLHIYV
jgi:hypothetical protein